MKYIVLALSMFFVTLTAEVPFGVQSVQVVDTNSEVLPGVKIELVGTGKTYYTNLKGFCLIPVEVLKSSKGVIIESVSYKTLQLENFELNSKIVLTFR